MVGCAINHYMPKFFQVLLDKLLEIRYIYIVSFGQSGGAVGYIWFSGRIIDHKFSIFHIRACEIYP